jgi:hypothetical protein
MKKELSIIVSGGACTGKSRVTFLLKEFLKEKGFEVDLVCDYDNPTEHHFDENMSRNIEEAISQISKNTSITLIQNQTMQPFKTNY